MTANSRSPVYGAVDIGFQSILKNYLPLADLRFDLDQQKGVPKRPTKDEARRMAANFAKLCRCCAGTANATGSHRRCVVAGRRLYCPHDRDPADQAAAAAAA